MSNSSPRTMRRKASIKGSTSTKSKTKVLGFIKPSLRARLLPCVRVTALSLSSAIEALPRIRCCSGVSKPNPVAASSGSQQSLDECSEVRVPGTKLHGIEFGNDFVRRHVGQHLQCGLGKLAHPPGHHDGIAVGLAREIQEP